MEKVNSFESIQVIVGDIRGRSSSFITNYYPNEKKDNELIKKGKLFIKIFDNSCFVIRKTDNFYDFSFIAKDTVSLDISLKDLVSNTSDIYVTDLLGIDGKIQDLERLFLDNGFSLRRSLQRMIKLGIEDSSRVDSDKVSFPILSEIPAIRQLLVENFDPYSEQIPSYEELQRFVENNQIYLYKEDSEIAGLIIFELTPMSFYLRYWFTNRRYRNKGVGSSLYKKVMYNSGNIKRQMLWVVSDNENAIKRYEHYGFKLDRLVDKVMVINK